MSQHTVIKSRELSYGPACTQLDAHSAFGVAHRGRLNGQDVAIKKTRLQGESDYFLLSSWGDEVYKLGRLQDQNIAKFIGVCEEPGNWALVQEWVEGKDLAAVIKSYPEGAPGQFAGGFVGLQIAEGLQYLHANNILHLNLSPGNVIVNASNTNLKLRDYGLRTFKMACFAKEPTHGNPRYVAPEVMMRQHDAITTAADVWSWAMVMWEVVTGSTVFKSYKPPQISRKIWEAGDRPDLEDVKDASFARFLEQCWATNPSSRATLAAVNSAARALGQSGSGGHVAHAGHHQHQHHPAPSNSGASLDDMLADLDSLEIRK